jgi:hypothetical protein
MTKDILKLIDDYRELCRPYKMSVDFIFYSNGLLVITVAIYDNDEASELLSMADRCSDDFTSLVKMCEDFDIMRNLQEAMIEAYEGAALDVLTGENIEDCMSFWIVLSADQNVSFTKM